MKLGSTFLILLAFAGPGLALEEPTPGDLPVTIASPSLLKAKEKIPDGAGWVTPLPPAKDMDGKLMRLENDDDHCPRGGPVTSLADPSVLSQIQGLNQSEKLPGKYQWHNFKDMNYCHFHNGDRDWYGWRTGKAFHWVLSRDGRFWWRDLFAERWLHLDKGYWWWQGRDSQPVQVYLEDGHYHVCDAQGVLGEDLWTTGVQQVETEPVSKETPMGSAMGKSPMGSMDEGGNK